MDFLRRHSGKAICSVILVTFVIIKIISFTFIYYNSKDTVIQKCGVTEKEHIFVNGTMSSFFVTLPSNVKTDLSNNTISNYTTQMPKKYIFPHTEEWEVGLAEISYPKTWYNIKTNQTISIFAGHVNSTTGDIEWNPRQTMENDSSRLPPGLYPDAISIIYQINDIIHQVFGGSIHRIPYLELNKYNQRASYKLGTSEDEETIYFLKFGEELSAILGFTAWYSNKTSLEHRVTYTGMGYADMPYTPDQIKNAYKSGSLDSFRPVDLYAGYHTLYAYTDIAEFSDVGNIFAQLLRTLEVPSSKSFGDQIVLTYQKPFFVPLLKREFHSIEIDIKEETGQSVPFEYGRVIVVLQFRQKHVK